MPKNKGKYRSQREKEKEALPPVEQVTTFTSRVMTQLKPHAYKIGAVLGGLVLVLAGFAIYSGYVEKRDKGATKAFGKAMETLRGEVVTEAEPPPDPSLPPPPKDPNAPPKFKSQQEKLEAALKDVTAVRSKYGSSGVARDALLVEAALLYDLGRYDEAITAYRKFLNKSPKGEVAFVAREGLGYAIEAKGLALQKTDPAAAKAVFAEALAEFAKLEPDEKGVHRDLALYHQARMKALMGDGKAALEGYKQLLEQFPGSALASDVQARVATLEEQQGS